MFSRRCQFCGSQNGETVLDLGSVPLSNALLTREGLDREEPRYPLGVWVCAECLLVQLSTLIAPEKIFSHYLYFSSYSQTWLKHCEQFADGICARLGLHGGSQVVEIGSNDGYLLEMFQKRGIPVLGVEPAVNIAEVAKAKGVPTEVEFFGAAAAERLRGRYAADLIVANNVFGHSPDIHSFVRGLELMLKPGGKVSLEAPHLLQMLRHGQFDTVYHEHVYYFSLLAVEKVLARYGLRVYDVEELGTHGGSLRIHAERRECSTQAGAENVERVRTAEHEAGLDNLETYRQFAPLVVKAKRELLEFFAGAAREGKRVVGYSASAKGINLLNYCDVGEGQLEYAVDLSPHKQGFWLPGTRAAIHAPERVFETKPDYLLILAWNLKEEVMAQMEGIRAWGGKFVVPIPELTILP